MSKHTLKLDDIEMVTIQEALMELQRVSGTPVIQTYIASVLSKCKASWDKKAEREADREAAKLTKRSKEALARDALVTYIEDVLFNPASRSQDAKTFRARFLKGRDGEVPAIKSRMLKDAKKFPEPAGEPWDYNGECPDYMDKKTWHPWYSGQVGGLACEISFNKSATKVTRVYVEID